MSRKRRDAQTSVVHHVVNRGNRRDVIFHKEDDYAAFLRVLDEARIRHGMRLISFCVMPNHWHLVLWPDKDVSLPAFMHWLTGTHVRRYHAHYQLVGTGHLYQDRYHNGICTSERRLLATLRYVEANALAAKLVQSAKDWPWGSLWLREHGDPERMLTDCPIALPLNWARYVDQVTIGSDTEEMSPEAEISAACTSADSSPEVV